MPEPINKTLYNRVRHMADHKFSKPGLYKSAWVVREYVKMGGRYKGKRDPHQGIVAAFRNQRSSPKKRRSSKRSKKYKK